MKLFYSSFALWSIFASFEGTPRLQPTIWKALKAAGIAKTATQRGSRGGRNMQRKITSVHGYGRYGLFGNRNKVYLKPKHILPSNMQIPSKPWNPDIENNTSLPSHLWTGYGRINSTVNTDNSGCIESSSNPISTTASNLQLASTQLRTSRGVNFKYLTYIKCTKTVRGFTPINFCLLNTRSINNKALAVKDYVVDNDLDIRAVTETWLGDNDNFSAAEVCPTGYYFHHESRTSSRGGGVGLLMKKHIRVNKRPLHKFKSFEHIDVMAKCSDGCMRIVVIYRPPTSKAKQVNGSLFFEEFSTLAELLAISPGNLIITGDFNYHMDDVKNPDTIKFNRILESFNLKQHVNGPTHDKGHTLDLMITRADDNLIYTTEIKKNNVIRPFCHTLQASYEKTST